MELELLQLFMFSAMLSVALTWLYVTRYRQESAMALQPVATASKRRQTL